MGRKLVSIFTMLLMCSIVLAQRQHKVDRSQELNIGHDLPYMPDQGVLNYSNEVIDIQSFNDKVVILDFFDTYCTNCIAAMPKLQKLQDEMGDKLQVILVTWQDKRTIEEFYASNAFLKEKKVFLPTIYSATLLRSYFPHIGVPHTVWLFQDRVQAVTYSDFVKAENVENLYAEGSLNLPFKSDFDDGLNMNQSKFIAGESIGSVKVFRYKEGVRRSGLTIQYDTINQMYKSSIYNMDILGAYKGVWSKVRKPKFVLKDERIVWNVSDSTRYKFFKEKQGINEWVIEHGISYERYDLVNRPIAEQSKLILNDLNSFLNLNVYWSTRSMPCLVISKTNKNLEKSLSGVNRNRIEGTGVLAFMIDYQGGFPPVVDNVNSMEYLDIEEYSTINDLNRQLSKYGLILIEEVREIDVLVFEECK